MVLSISDRIKLIIKEFGLTKNSFSKAIGLSNNVTIGRIVNEERKPSFEILEKIIQTYGSINARWLISGEGEMLKEDMSKAYPPYNLENLPAVSEQEPIPKFNIRDTYFEEEINKLNRVIVRLVRKNDALENQIEELKSLVNSQN